MTLTFMDYATSFYKAALSHPGITSISLTDIFNCSQTSREARRVYREFLQKYLAPFFKDNPLAQRLTYQIYLPFEQENALIQFGPFPKAPNSFHMAIERLPQEKSLPERMNELYRKRFAQPIRYSPDQTPLAESLHCDVDRELCRYIGENLISPTVLPHLVKYYYDSTEYYSKQVTRFLPSQIRDLAQYEGCDYLFTEGDHFIHFVDKALTYLPDEQTQRENFLREHKGLIAQLRSFPGFSFAILTGIFRHRPYTSHFVPYLNINTNLSVLIELLEKKHTSFEKLGQLLTNHYFNGNFVLTNTLVRFLDQGYFTLEQFVDGGPIPEEFLMPYDKQNETDFLYKFNLLNNKIFQHFYDQGQLHFLSSNSPFLQFIYLLHYKIIVGISNLVGGFYNNALPNFSGQNDELAHFNTFLREMDPEDMSQRIINDFQELVTYAQKKVDTHLTPWRERDQQNPSADFKQKYEQLHALLMNRCAEGGGIFYAGEDEQIPKHQITLTHLKNAIDKVLQKESQNSFMTSEFIDFFFSLPLQEIKEGLLMHDGIFPATFDNRFYKRYLAILFFNKRSRRIEPSDPNIQPMTVDKISSALDLFKQNFMNALSTSVEKIKQEDGITIQIPDETNFMNFFTAIYRSEAIFRIFQSDQELLQQACNQHLKHILFSTKHDYVSKYNCSSSVSEAKKIFDDVFRLYQALKEEKTGIKENFLMWQ